MASRDRLSPRLRARRLFALILWVVAPVALVGYAFIPSGASARSGRMGAEVNPRLPDLAMAPVEACCVGVTEDDRWVLRFSAAIANVGSGDFLVEARRWNRFGGWSIRQQINEDGDGFTDSARRGAELVWGGDGHDHWHVGAIETHWLETYDGSNVIATVLKSGFCFFDTTEHDLTLERAPARAAWSESGCGRQVDTSILLGLSVGWGDTYEWHLFEQHVDITDLAPGRYRIRAVADPQSRFRESDETNNETWTVIDFTIDDDGLQRVAVVDEAPQP